jgi:DNA primase
MSDTVQQIKERLSITDIVSPYVKLKKAGKSLVGLCPFHKEKTPSFHVSSERGTWHCFGCGLGGDGFSFIEKIEGVDFKGALKILAEKAGVVIEYSGNGASEDKSKKERLLDVMSRASEWYAEKFSGSPAEEYAKGRGLTEKTIREWRLGFAPSGWRALLEALSAEGFSISELLAAGLIKEADGKQGTFYDRFRNRLMFPICDSAGRVVAFTGRTLSADEPAKYLNSPETELYHKSDILFGMDRAKDAIRARGFAMLVEGQMDVLLAQQIGFENAVALSGTALSEKHIALMKRYSENLMLVLDSDAAGLSATAKSAALALSLGLKVKAARLAKWKDPAELIRENPKEFPSYIAAAKPIVDFFLASLAEQERDPHRLISAAERIVLPLIAAIGSPMEREHFMQSTARALGLSNEAIRESLHHLPKHSEVTNSIANAQNVKGAATRSPKDIRSEQLISILHAYPDTPLAERVKSEYSRIIGDQPFPADIPPESALFKAEKMFGEKPEEGAADELLRAFEETIVREAYQEAVMQLRKVEVRQPTDNVAIKDAQAACTEISARLAALH